MPREIREVEITTPVTARRIHEIALQRWLHRSFIVKEGYPVPVVFSTPMDAFGEFTRLWGSGENPFTYLYDARDECGAPLYEPFPAPVRYPLISVKRGNTSLRPYQNFATREDRGAYYRSASPDIQQRDLGVVVTRQMPTAWDFKWQITHHCLRPDTQAIFEHKLQRAMRHSAGVIQTFIPVVYPQHHGMHFVRLILTGDIEDNSPEPSTDEQTQYWTSFSITMEGWNVDIDERYENPLWEYVYDVGCLPLPIEEVNRLFELVHDGREFENNPVFRLRDNLPPRGTFNNTE